MWDISGHEIMKDQQLLRDIQDLKLEIQQLREEISSIRNLIQMRPVTIPPAHTPPDWGNPTMCKNDNNNFI